MVHGCNCPALPAHCMVCCCPALPAWCIVAIAQPSLHTAWCAAAQPASRVHGKCSPACCMVGCLLALRAGCKVCYHPTLPSGCMPRSAVGLGQRLVDGAHCNACDFAGEDVEAIASELVMVRESESELQGANSHCNNSNNTCVDAATIMPLSAQDLLNNTTSTRSLTMPQQLLCAGKMIGQQASSSLPETTPQPGSVFVTCNLQLVQATKLTETRRKALGEN
eukprot:364426-Chlamydomonas_euryale.AAC.47